MLLQFELCGQDTTGSSYAFHLDQALNFTRLVLKDVRLVCERATKPRRADPRPSVNRNLRQANAEAFYVNRAQPCRWR